MIEQEWTSGCEPRLRLHLIADEQGDTHHQLTSPRRSIAQRPTGSNSDNRLTSYGVHAYVQDCHGRMASRPELNGKFRILRLQDWRQQHNLLAVNHTRLVSTSGRSCLTGRIEVVSS